MFCSFFLGGSIKTILAIFVKSKKRASAPSRGRIKVVPELLYQSLKIWSGAKKYSRLKFNSNHAIYRLMIISPMNDSFKIKNDPEREQLKINLAWSFRVRARSAEAWLQYWFLPL